MLSALMVCPPRFVVATDVFQCLWTSPYRYRRNTIDCAAAAMPARTQSDPGSGRGLTCCQMRLGRRLDVEVQLEEFHRRELDPGRQIGREVAVGEGLAVLA
jgi:hypothetical protein